MKLGGLSRENIEQIGAVEDLLVDVLMTFEGQRKIGCSSRFNSGR